MVFLKFSENFTLFFFQLSNTISKCLGKIYKSEANFGKREHGEVCQVLCQYSKQVQT